jgi:hypothetical protein
MGRRYTMKRTFTTFACILALSACAGGGSTPVSRSAQTQGAVALSIHIPETTTSSNRRVPKYVSPSTQGMQISDSVHGSGITSYTANVDLSSSSASCSATSSGRTCTTSITAPATSDDFAFTTYDVPPSSASFGLAAHELGAATVTTTIVGGASNTVNVALGGVPNSLKLLVPYSTFYASAPLTFNLGMEALDVDNNIILAGFNTATNGANSETDTYASPITITLAEANPNGAGDTRLSLNGGAAATHVTVTKTTDTVTASYDGLAPANYSISLSATAASVSPNPPALTVIPMFIAGSGAGAFVGGASPTLSFQVPNQSETFTVTEANYTGTFSVVNGFSPNCGGGISLNTSSLAGSGTSFTIAATNSATVNTGCQVVISDGNSASVTVYVTNAADPILYVPDRSTIAVDMYDSITYGSLGSFSVANGNATSGYQPVAAALDQVFGRLWVSFDKTPIPFVNYIPSGLVQAYATTSNNSLISSANLQFGGTTIDGIAASDAGLFQIFVNLSSSAQINVYNISSNTPSPSTTITSTPLSGGLYYDDATSLLYNAGNVSSYQNFAQAYTTSNTLHAGSTIAPPASTDVSFGIAVNDADDLVYVTDTATNTVDIFNYSAGNRQVGTIAAPGGGASILGVLLDAHDKLWVSYSNEILIYNVGIAPNNNPLLHTIVTNAQAYGMAISPGT